MLRRIVSFSLAAAFIWPGAVVAQEEMMEEEAPPMLMISSWKCDFGDMGAIDEDWQTRGVPSAQAAIDAGHWYSAGVFYHDWADEWNVHFWAVGESEASLIEGQDASNSAYEAEYGEGLNPWDHCSEHKDSFYQLANGTDSDAGAPGPSMGLSSWKCTDVGAVWDGWNDYTRARAQSVVDAGTWNDAGMFVHSWGAEWNVNFYYMADDIPSILEGWQAFMNSMGDDAPDLLEYCSEHKDGFYQFGQTVTAEEEMSEGD